MIAYAIKNKDNKFYWIYMPRDEIGGFQRGFGNLKMATIYSSKYWAKEDLEELEDCKIVKVKIEEVEEV